MRTMMNDEKDYSMIIAIIALFYQQGFAKYYDARIDKDYKQMMRFGDILLVDWEEYMVMDINNEMKGISGGLFGDDVDIPLSICKYLSNAVEFYSKWDEEKLNSTDATIQLFVKYDDEWLINHFDGALNPQFESIAISFEDEVNDDNFQEVCICFTNKYEKYFNPIKNKITHQDINMYYESRKDPKNLVKINVSLAQQYVRRNIERIKLPSALWERIWLDDSDDDCYHLIGPKSEKDEMMNTLKKAFGAKFDDIVSVAQLEQKDYIAIQ